MKTNNVIVLLIILVIIAFAWLFIRAKKNDDTIGDIGEVIRKKFVGDTSYSANDKEWLKDALGLGEMYLQSFSNKDAATARAYIENYIRKGIKILPNDALYNDVVRIASYSQLFSKP